MIKILMISTNRNNHNKLVYSLRQQAFEAAVLGVLETLHITVFGLGLAGNVFYPVAGVGVRAQEFGHALSASLLLHFLKKAGRPI